VNAGQLFAKAARKPVRSNAFQSPGSGQDHSRSPMSVPIKSTYVYTTS